MLDRLNRNGKRELALYNAIKNILKEKYVEFSSAKKIASTSTETAGEVDLNEESDKKIVNEIEEANKKVREYTSIYQPERPYMKAKTKVNKSLHLLEITRDKILKTEITHRATSEFILNLLLDIEQEFTLYLQTRKCRWIDKTGREILRREAQDNLSESKVGELLVLLNNRFIHIETFVRKDDIGNGNNEIDDNSENDENEIYNMKKRKNKLWKADKDAEEEKEENHFDEDFETDPKYTMKKKILKTWGFYNEKFKQAWEIFVSNAEGNHIGALYLGAVIFIEIICRYISRKNQKVPFLADPER